MFPVHRRDLPEASCRQPFGLLARGSRSPYLCNATVFGSDSHSAPSVTCSKYPRSCVSTTWSRYGTHGRSSLLTTTAPLITAGPPPLTGRATRATPPKGGDAKLRGCGAPTRAMPAELPKHLCEEDIW